MQARSSRFFCDPPEVLPVYPLFPPLVASCDESGQERTVPKCRGEYDEHFLVSQIFPAFLGFFQCLFPVNGHSFFPHLAPVPDARAFPVR